MKPSGTDNKGVKYEIRQEVLEATLDQVVRAVRRRYSAAGYPPSAAGWSPPQRSLSAGLPRRSAVERGGSRPNPTLSLSLSPRPRSRPNPLQEPGP